MEQILRTCYDFYNGNGCTKEGCPRLHFCALKSDKTDHSLFEKHPNARALLRSFFNGKGQGKGKGKGKGKIGSLIYVFLRSGRGIFTYYDSHILYLYCKYEVNSMDS